MVQDPIKILVVDDDPALLAVLEAGLSMHEDYAVTAVVSASEAMRRILTQPFDLVITDYSLGDANINGLALLRLVRDQNDSTLVIIITAFASLEITLESIHLGAYDFLTKPFQLDELQLVIRNAATHSRLERENQYLRQQVSHLIDSLDEIERQHTELLDRIRQADGESSLTDASASSIIPPLNSSSSHEIRCRRTREQLTTYVRMGETIREQLTRERQKIETLFQKGLLPENAYRRAMMERK